MPRKGPAPRRELMPDPIYRSVRRHPGRQQDPAARQALHRRAHRLRRARRSSRPRPAAEPVATLKRAVDNVKPQLEVRSRRVGGATYQVPGRGAPPPGQHPRHPLDRRLLAASAVSAPWPSASPTSCSTPANGVGASVKRKEDLHKMAESNKAFAHYRW